MFKHNVQNNIPSIDLHQDSQTDRSVNKRDPDQKQKMKLNADERRRAKSTDFTERDTILLQNLHKQNKLSTHYETDPYTIVKVYRR